MTRTNSNYQIEIVSRINENEEIVIGYNPVSKFWVCWTCLNNDYYYAGTYSEDAAEVLDEYINRGGY